jgi:hypothetical protein
MPLVAVVPLAPCVSCITVPSIVRRSVAPSETLDTLRSRRVRLWPASTVETAAALNTLTAAPSSVYVGLPGVALSVGAS